MLSGATAGHFGMLAQSLSERWQQQTSNCPRVCDVTVTCQLSNMEGGGAYGAGMSTGHFDCSSYIKKPQVKLRSIGLVGNLMPY